jgi:hypothetical protein
LLTRGRGAGWVKNPKPSCRGSVTGVPCKMAVGGGSGRWWVRVKGKKVAGGLRVRQCEARGVKNPKLSHRGSVTGVPRKTAVGARAGRWWVWSKGTEMAGGLRVRKREVGRRGLGQKPESERLWLDFGLAA